jgi:hypothetical protein
LADVADQRELIAANGTQLAFVHQGPEEYGKLLLERYGLHDLPRLSDPKRALYRVFELRVTTPLHFLRPKVWKRSLENLLQNKNRGGRPVGNILQMPGAFLLRQGEIIRAFRHETIADRPDYQKLAV